MGCDLIIISLVEVIIINVIQFNVIKIVVKGFGVSVNPLFERNSLVKGSSGTYPAGWVGGWLGGWVVGQSEIKANSASVAVEVEVEAELGNFVNAVGGSTSTSTMVQIPNIILIV